MKKNLKYIKIEGTLTSKGDSTPRRTEYRSYSAVTIVDQEGSEIHFRTLSISKRMDERLNFDQPMTFYILRADLKGKMVGVLYATECNGSKIYYPDTAIPALKSLGLHVRNRHVFITEPIMALGGLIVGGGLLSLALGEPGLGYSFAPAAILGFGGFGLYLFSPLIFDSQGAGISEMEEILSSDGFNAVSSTNPKY